MTNEKRRRLIDSMKTRDEHYKKQKYQLPKEEQFNYIKEIKNSTRLEQDEKWFLISTKWYNDFKSYCRGDIDRLSTIDNSSLFDKDYRVKGNLICGKDYILLPKRAWESLIEWYGINDERFIVKRSVKSLYHFEVYQMHQKSSQRKTFNIDCEATVKDFYQALVSALNLSASISCVWILKRPIESNAFITESLLDTLAVKTIHPSTIPTHVPITNYLPNKDERRYFLAIKTESTTSSTVTRGLRGLNNLGNTCYMNSAIQCLSNTPKLTYWLLKDLYKKDINRYNPLGLRGELAESYASLIKSIWRTEHSSSISPYEFKKTFERFNSHFSGYEQQDSQEFLGFLLDGLHEDMNRVHHKPYVQMHDYEDESQQEEIADQLWKYHKSRNNSVIVDLFQGQFKNKLRCNECNKVSITFDPFMHLSLPIPVSICKLNITFIYYHKPRQCKFTVSLTKQSRTIADLKQAIMNKLKDSKHFLITRMFQSKICTLYKDSDPLSAIQLTDIIYVYEIPFAYPDPNWILFPVYFQLIDNDSTHFNMFGYPSILAFDTSKDAPDLYTSISLCVQRYTAKALVNEDGTPIEQGMFTIKTFINKESEDADFPLLKPPTDVAFMPDEHDPNTIQQGQAILTQWKKEKAFEIFGSAPKRNNPDVLTVNTSLWRAFDNLANGNQQDQLDIYACLREFTREEHLTDDDLWYCPRCKKQQKATKKLDLWRLPEIMIIHLKRFSQVRMWRNKLNAFVDFPISGLDMTDYVIDVKDDDRLVYDLYAIDNHYGDMGGGHYTAYAQNAIDKQWYDFDDTSVTKIDERRIKTSAAYVLFYKRRRRRSNVD
ncbi:hypothetical protein RMCBS344292_09537 [Rhizopus microsporus]|nr:hypothetical protein RMCBS344292_09537 [Rhizopus microsporus]